MSPTETNESRSKSAGRRIWNFFKALLITLFLLVLLAALAAGGYLGFQELQRSFNNVYARIDLLRSDVNTLMENDPVLDRDLDALGEELDAGLNQLNEQDERLLTLESSLSEDLSAQAETLTLLEAGLLELESGLAGVITRTGGLEENMLALQGDVNENTTQIDAFGGDVDAVRADLLALEGLVEDVETTAVAASTDAGAAVVISDTVQVELVEMQQTLALFRAWSVISRARLRLVEGNVGLATSDVELAIALLDGLILAAPETEVARLSQSQSRLQLALTNLPANSAGAALDLEQAWDDIDAVLAARLSLLPLANP